MPEDKDREKTLSGYRLEKSKEMLEDAETLYVKDSYRSSNNRSYYSIYHAMRAVIALDKVDFKKHSGNIQFFQKEYIKSGRFDVKCSEIILSASKIRNASDYDDFYIASKEEAKEQLENAKYFYNQVETYLKRLIL